MSPPGGSSVRFNSSNNGASAKFLKDLFGRGILSGKERPSSFRDSYDEFPNVDTNRFRSFFHRTRKEIEKELGKG